MLKYIFFLVGFILWMYIYIYRYFLFHTTRWNITQKSNSAQKMFFTLYLDVFGFSWKFFSFNQYFFLRFFLALCNSLFSFAYSLNGKMGRSHLLLADTQNKRNNLWYLLMDYSKYKMHLEKGIFDRKKEEWRNWHFDSIILLLIMLLHR